MIKQMATRLDQQIEQLERIVEECLNLCKMTRNGLRCTLPAMHEPTKPHKFRWEFSSDAKSMGEAVPLQAGTTRSEEPC